METSAVCNPLLCRLRPWSWRAYNDPEAALWHFVACARTKQSSLVALVDLEAIFLVSETSHTLRLRCLLSFQLPPERVTRSFQMRPQITIASNLLCVCVCVGLLSACGDGETGASLSVGLMRSPGAGLRHAVPCNPGLRLRGHSLSNTISELHSVRDSLRMACRAAIKSVSFSTREPSWSTSDDRPPGAGLLNPLCCVATDGCQLGEEVAMCCC